MPYPTTDPALYNGQYISNTVSRTFLFFYSGGVHGDCVEIRKAMKQLISNSTALPFRRQVAGRHLVGLCPSAVGKGQAKREHGFRESVFCPVPVGDSPSSQRMYDALNFG